MSKQLQVASGIAVAATLLTALLGSTGSDAIAQAAEPAIMSDTSSPQIPALQPEPAPGPVDAQNVAEPQAQPDSATRARSLADHVSAQPRAGALDSEMRCLAGAIYFEARGESLAGQLAVGRVVVERASSGRFPASYCGVVYQRSQFSFVRGRSMPAIHEGSAAWQRAVAIARIADEGTWQSPADGALFFHASHVSPGWRKKRLARVDNHIFYR